MVRGPLREPPKRWNPNPAGRPPDTLIEHPEHGHIGSLAAISREMGHKSHATVLNWRTRFPDRFPQPILGNVYALSHVQAFKDAHVRARRPAD